MDRQAIRNLLNKLRQARQQVEQPIEPQSEVVIERFIPEEIEIEEEQPVEQLIYGRPVVNPKLMDDELTGYTPLKLPRRKRRPI